jgi:hypothetical protein
LTAVPRRRDAAAVLDHWHRADGWRREWLRTGLSTEPADRDTAEEILTRVYQRHGRARPRFTWVGSPVAALDHTAGIPGHDDLHAWLRPRSASWSTAAAGRAPSPAASGQPLPHFRMWIGKLKQVHRKSWTPGEN